MTVATFPVSRLHRGADQFDALIKFYGKDSAGLDQVLNWSSRDISNPSTYEDGPWDGRVLSFGRYDLSLADRAGQFSGTTLQYTIADIAGQLIGAMLNNPLQAVLPGIQNVIKGIFESDRLASVDPAVLFRGLVQAYEGPSAFQVQFQGVDWLSPRIAQNLPMAKVGRAFPGAPQASRERLGQLAFGRRSDEGSSTAGPLPVAETASGAGAANPGGPCGYGSLANGVSVPTGGALAEEAGGSIDAGVDVYVQYWKTSGGIAGDPDAASFAYGSRGATVTTSGGSKAVRATCTDDGDGAIYNFAIGVWSGSAGRVLYNQILSTTDPTTGVLFTVLAADGSGDVITPGASFPSFNEIHNYAMTAILADQETVIATFWAAVIGPYRRPSRVVGTPVPGADSYNVYRKQVGDADWGRVWGVPTTSINGDGNIVFNDDQNDTGVTYIEGAPTPKGVVPGIPIGPIVDITGSTRQGVAFSAHAWAQLDALYLRDSSGAVIRRIDDGEYGVGVFAPGKPGFSTFFSSDFYDAPDGTRWFLVYFTGPDGMDIAAGTKTVYANGTCWEDVGDGTGSGVVDGVDQVAEILDNFGLTDTPYAGGLHAASIPTWADGSPRRDAASFTAAKAHMAASLATGTARGFLVTQPTKIVDLLAGLMLSIDCTYGFTKGGQFRILLEPPLVDLTPVASFTEFGEIVVDSFKWKDQTDPAFWWNEVNYSYQPTYGADGSVTFAKTANLANLAAQRQAGQIVDPNTTAFLSIPSSSMAAEIAARRLARASVALRTCIVQSGVNGLDPDLGDVVAITSREYPAPGGCVNRPMQIRRQSPDLDGLAVEFEVWDPTVTGTGTLRIEDLMADDFGGSRDNNMGEQPDGTYDIPDYKIVTVFWNSIPSAYVVRVRAQRWAPAGGTQQLRVTDLANSVVVSGLSTTDTAENSEELIVIPRPGGGGTKQYKLRNSISGVSAVGKLVYALGKLEVVLP